MKTIYDSNYSNKYVILFDEAYKILSDAGKIRKDDNAEKIESLEHYFSYIGDLVDMHVANVAFGTQDNQGYSEYSKFLMLPMDEVFGKNIFSINSDSRSIEVPASFKTNGVSVTGDILAETLLFEIDRFFDITDLASTDIYIQWMNPAGTQGASKVTIVDYKTKPGKLVFGWPLTDKITVEGKDPLKFSVRFIKRGDNNEIVYTLNTMPASVKINQALFTVWNEDIIPENANEMLDKAISNGPVGGGVDPLVPVYVIDLTGGAMTLTNDSAELKVEAASGDNGTLTYSWYLVPKFIENNEIKTETDDGKKYVPVASEEKYIPTTDESFVAKKVYYTLDGEGAYVVYDNDKGWTNGLYEKMSVCKINWTEGEHITGEYYVNVINTIGGRPTNNVRSKSIFFNCPEKVEFNKNLAADVFMANNKARLEVGANATPADAEISYEWFAIDSEGESMKLADGAVYEASAAGWYKSIATAALNREVLTAESAICRVLAPIQAPVIIAPPADEEEYRVLADENGEFTLEVEYELSTDKLVSDSVDFTWYRKTSDVGDAIVAIGDEDVVSMDGNILKVKPKNDKSVIDYFYCVITNNLAGQKKSATSGVFMII